MDPGACSPCSSQRSSAREASRSSSPASSASQAELSSAPGDGSSSPEGSSVGGPSSTGHRAGRSARVRRRRVPPAQGSSAAARPGAVLLLVPGSGGLGPGAVGGGRLPGGDRDSGRPDHKGAGDQERACALHRAAEQAASRAVLDHWAGSPVSRLWHSTTCRGAILADSPALRSGLVGAASLPSRRPPAGEVGPELDIHLWKALRELPDVLLELETSCRLTSSRSSGFARREPASRSSRPSGRRSSGSTPRNSCVRRSSPTGSDDTARTAG